MSDLSTTPGPSAPPPQPQDDLEPPGKPIAVTPPASAKAATPSDDPVPEVPSPETAPTLSIRRVVLSTVLGIALLMATIAVIGYWFRAPLLAVSEWFVTHTGGPGIAVGFFLPDAFTIPLPNDAFGMFGLAGGLPFWEVAGWATLGSVVGGSIGWLIGNRIRRTRRITKFLTGRGAYFAALIQRYGILVVAIAALTPLPYSVSAWAAGVTCMRFPTFLLVSLLRFFRVVGALYLIELGLQETL